MANFWKKKLQKRVFRYFFPHISYSYHFLSPILLEAKRYIKIILRRHCFDQIECFFALGLVDFSSEIKICVYFFSLPSKSNWKLEYLKHPAMDYSKPLILKHSILKTIFFKLVTEKPIFGKQATRNFSREGTLMYALMHMVCKPHHLSFVLWLSLLEKDEKSNMYHKQKKQIFLALTVKIIDMYINSLHCWYHSNCDH